MSWTADVWSSLAFVVAGAWILATTPRRVRALDDDARRERVLAQRSLGVLAVLVGVGSAVQHGPAPAWNSVVHDPPLLGAYALVAADALADLTGRELRTWWWLVPVLADVALAATWPLASMVAQGTAAAVAVVAVLLRARARPALRRRLLAAIAVLGVGAVLGELSRPGRPWSDGATFDTVPGHAVWHVLAAVAIAVVAPAVGRRPTDSSPR
ncbi:hypothetical protein M1843_16120 [Isoptericola sp. 4D.3]|uniref:Ceramidase n=1 Tax=Isoptericola peretonis TaxID=2918523 RepID=A0ABT0J706_9MICO|nr:hypothetical protein [Isoptericola sp. 4D.3]